jgi:hypothetical protein
MFALDIGFHWILPLIYLQSLGYKGFDGISFSSAMVGTNKIGSFSSFSCIWITDFGLAKHMLDSLF